MIKATNTIDVSSHKTSLEANEEEKAYNTAYSI